MEPKIITLDSITGWKELDSHNCPNKQASQIKKLAGAIDN